MQKQSYKKLVGDITQIFEISNKGFVLRIRVGILGYLYPR